MKRSIKTSITKIFTFDAAHDLPWHDGKCKNLHGHTYKLEVTVTGPVKETGVIMDFNELKDLVGDEFGFLDHSYLNEYLKNPTAELLAESIFNGIKIVLPGKVKIERVRLWETQTSYVDIVEEEE